jgi:hypothetical protein
MNKKICVLMLVGLFLLVTLQSISAVEMKTGVTTSNDAEINSEPSSGGIATVEGYVRFANDMGPHYKGEPVKNEEVHIEARGLFQRYKDTVKTDDDGYYIIYGVPAGSKNWLGKDVEFKLSCYVYEYPSWLYDFEGYEYRYFKDPDKYQVNIDVWGYMTTHSHQQSNQQQVESTFSGSQSL